MQRIPYYAILSGFEPGNFPGVGTFYDFFKRLQPKSKLTTFANTSALAFLPLVNTQAQVAHEQYFPILNLLQN